MKLLLPILLLIGMAGAQIDKGDAIDTTLAGAYFKQAEALSQQDAGRLWGVPLYGPFFFVDAATQQIVANQADKEGKLTRQGDVWVGKLPPNVLPAPKAGVFVRRLKLCVVEAGSDVKKICAVRCGLSPSLSCAAAGNVPSGRKFNAEVKTRLAGTSPPL